MKKLLCIFVGACLSGYSMYCWYQIGRSDAELKAIEARSLARQKQMEFINTLLNGGNVELQ